MERSQRLTHRPVPCLSCLMRGTRSPLCALFARAEMSTCFAGFVVIHLSRLESQISQPSFQLHQGIRNAGTTSMTKSEKVIVTVWPLRLIFGVLVYSASRTSPTRSSTARGMTGRGPP